jgi:predicted metal-binding protein
MADDHSRHRITICTLCRLTDGPCRPGLALIEKLNQALAASAVTGEQDFTVQGYACLAGCARPCTVAFSASQKATYLFGDMKGDDADIDALVGFAELYASRTDGMSRSPERPVGLKGKILARVPAAILKSEAGAGPLQ